MRQSFDRRSKLNNLKPFGYGKLGLAAVRATLNEDPEETVGGTAGEGQTVTPKRRRSHAARKGGCVLPEYTAAGSNAEMNDEVASGVRMGDQVKGAKVCSSCYKANVGLDFLLHAKHSRQGKTICPQIRKDWQKRVEEKRAAGASGKEIEAGACVD